MFARSSLCVASITLFIVAMAGLAYGQQPRGNAPVKVILDTDMLTDPEDVNALWLLNALADRGEAEILACVVNGHEWNRASGAAVDTVNTWFGRPNLPLGAFKGGYPVKKSPFTPLLRDKYAHTAPSDDALPSAVEIYRRALAGQPDRSVKIVSIGFLLNLADLLASQPDAHSKLTGRELIRAKVQELVVMGGKYPKGREYNFYFGGVQGAAVKVVDAWPAEVPIVFSGYELGGSIISGKTYKQTLADGPLRLALANQYNALDRGRESWDETAVLYAVRGLSYHGFPYWKLHSGRVVVDPKDGSNSWIDGPDKRQAYLVAAQPPERLAQVLEELVLGAKPRGALVASASDGVDFAGAYAASKNYTPPTDPAVIEKLHQWQDQKLGLLISWQACTQWGIDSWPLCPERYPWNARRDFVHGVDSPFAADDRAYKKAYEELIATFNPVRFNPDKWAAAAKDAGVKYVLVMAKHHDGFCMWNTAATDYKITAPRCPFHPDPRADIVKRMSAAFRKQGVNTGVYFSKSDWNCPYYWSPDFPLRDRNNNYDALQHAELWKKFKQFTWRQIEELMTGYGPQDILWLDGGQVRPPRQDIDMAGLAAMARRHQPGLIVVDRTVRGAYENYVTPEGEHAMPAHFLPYPWEVCMTMAGHWNYFPKDPFKSGGRLIRDLCRIVARGGNFLIGIGPDASGEFDPAVYARLAEIGAWLKLNGEAIYATRPIAPYECGDCVFTRKRDGVVYAIVLAKDDKAGPPATVSLPTELLARTGSITLLGYGDINKPNKVGDIEIPAAVRARPPCAHAWVLKLTPRRS